MGTQTYSNTATQDKIEYEISKYPLQATLGFRISGMKTFQPNTNQLLFRDRKWGRTLNDENMVDALRSFFDAGDQVYRTDMIMLLVRSLQQLEQLFSKPIPFQLIASSVLFMFEADTGPISQPQGINEEDTWKRFKAQNVFEMTPGKIAEVRLIDFTHLIMHNEKPMVDHGMLTGIRNLIKYLSILYKTVQFSVY